MRRLAAITLLLPLAACDPGGSGTVVPTTAVATSTTTSTVASTTTASVTGSIVLREVVDGDTIRVRIDGSEETVRLIGINAPEAGECLADTATIRLEELIADATIELESDRSDRDRFGRLLRYVWVEDTLVNEALVADGLAIAVAFEPDTAYQDRLAAAQAQAERAGVGIWDAAACGTAAGVALVIEHIEYDAPGDDAANLNGEWVEIVNTGDGEVDLTGWVLRDESSTHRYAFPAGTTLPSGARLRVYSGCGDDTADSLHWCVSGSAIWNNDGDTAFLLDGAGNVVTNRSY
jgi:micrococcal nuclease